MKTNIEMAIDKLVAQINPTLSVDALRLTQAALNLAHVQATLVGATHLQNAKS